MNRGVSGTDHAHARDLLGPYVLGALDPEEEQEVERHLTTCAECREDERGIRETHERIAGAALAHASVPPQLKERIFAALPEAREEPRRARRNGRRSGRRRSFQVALIAAAALLVIGLGAVAFYSAGLFDPAETAALTPTEIASGARGEIAVSGSRPDAEADLEVSGLPRTEPNEYYELWFIREEGRVGVGTFTVDSEGQGQLSAGVPEVEGGYQSVAITLERFPDEPSPTSAKVVLGAEL